MTQVRHSAHLDVQTYGMQVSLCAAAAGGELLSGIQTSGQGALWQS